MKAQELVDALLHEHAALNGQTVTAHGRTYILEVEDAYEHEDEPTWWDIQLNSPKEAKLAKLQQQLNDLESDPVAVFVAEKREMIQREMRRIK